MLSPTLGLLHEEAFSMASRSFHEPQDVEIVYKRARMICQRYNISREDVLHLSDKFWDFHTDGILLHDIRPFILLTIQFNLVAGTLAPFATRSRPEVQKVLNSILSFEVSAQFMLTELGHGLDAKNLETVATVQDDGSFDLHTPHPGAAKFMPPSYPITMCPRIAIVIAKLIVNNKDRGVRPFIVSLSDGSQMCKGVSSSLIPPLGSTSALDHSLTSFDHVRLSSEALLGTLEPPSDLRENFFSVISRVAVGTCCLSTLAITLLKASVVIAARYSRHRRVGQEFVQHGHAHTQVPIISFRTQQIPIIRAVAQIRVMDAFKKRTIEVFRDIKVDPFIRNAHGVFLKAVFLCNAQRSIASLIERCGAQGLFSHNQLTSFETTLRWLSIAEGDILVLSIRLATELLIRRYDLPPQRRPSCLLRKETMFIERLRLRMLKLLGGHRGEAYNHSILPHCRSLIELIGHRMAYDAAVEAGLDRDLLTIYETTVVQELPSSYFTQDSYPEELRLPQEILATNLAFEKIDEDLESFQEEVEPYLSAPILDPLAWDRFLKSCPTFVGDGVFGLFDGHAKSEADATADTQSRLVKL